MKIIIPDNWNQVTVEQYVKLSGLNMNEHLIEIVSILSGRPINEVEKFPTESFSEIIRSIDWILKVPSDEHKRAITVNESEYYLIKLSDLTIREWINLIAMVKEYNKNLIKIFQTLYRDSEGKPGSGFENAYVSDLYGALVFFCNTEKRYLEIMQTSLMNQTMTQMKPNRLTKTKRYFRGLNLFTRWHKANTVT